MALVTAVVAVWLWKMAARESASRTRRVLVFAVSGFCYVVIANVIKPFWLLPYAYGMATEGMVIGAVIAALYLGLTSAFRSGAKK